MPLATDAYLADTHHLTTLQHGIYLKLLITAWRTRGTPRLPNDDKLLARYAGLDPRSWRANRATIMAFWTLGEDGFWTQRKQLKTREIVSKKSSDAKEKAARRWGDKSLENKDQTDAAAMPEPCRDDAIQNQTLLREIEEPKGSLSETSSDEPLRKKSSRKSYPADFEAAWRAYPRTPNMSKAEALPAWRKLSVEDHAAVLRSIPGYVAYLKTTPDLQTIHFVRYLSKRRFEGFAEGGAGTVTEGDWQKRLTWARDKKTWSSTEWGAMPGHPGCLVPAELMIIGDGVDWTEWSANRKPQGAMQ